MEEIKTEKINISSNRLKKVLSICLLCLLFFLIALFVYEYVRITPSNVRFTNVTSSSATISWDTKKPISATAVYKKGDGGFINLLGIGKHRFYDTRDVTRAELRAVQETSKNIAKSDDMTVSMNEVKTEVKVTEKGKYYTHHVEIKGLDPESEYSFFVGDELLYRAVKDTDGNTTVKTKKVAEGINTPVPAYGSVYDSMNTELQFDQLVSINDGIIYFKLVDSVTKKESNVLSSVLNNEGNWYLDISDTVDNEGNPFMKTYDTIDGNIYAELIINAGNLGIWKKKDSAYMLTPATITVINMPNAVNDPNIEGAVVRIDEEASVKGVSKTTLAERAIDDPESICVSNGLGTWVLKRTGGRCECPANAELKASGVCQCKSGYTQNGRSCIKDIPSPLCSCPEGYSGTFCSGAGCASVEATGNNCRKRTCYKKTINNNSSTKDCSYFSTFSCSSDCFFINSSGNYERCEKGECNKQRLKELGLNCDDNANTAAEQENPTCAGSAKLGQCTYVSGEGCKQCKWMADKNGGYRAIWSKVDDKLCGDLKSQSVINCPGLPKCTNGTIDLDTNKCVCKEGYYFDEDTGSCSKISKNSGEKCYLDGKYGYYSSDLICRLDGDECHCSGNKGQGYYEGGKCICSEESPVKPITPSSCTKKNIVYEYNPFSVNVCNGSEYVPLDGLCYKDGKPGNWNENGDCDTGNEVITTPISETTPEQYCWMASGTFFFYISGELYECDKETHTIKGPIANDYRQEVIDCKKFCSSGGPNGTDKSCHSGFLNLGHARYCNYEGVNYYCQNNTWKKADDIREGDDVVAETMVTIEPGKECTGKSGDPKCRCSNSNRIIEVGEWCVQVESCSLGDNGRICKLDGTKCKDGSCSDSNNIKSEVPGLKVDLREACSYPKCRCNGGYDNLKLINRLEYCREVSSCSEDNINKICASTGNTCKPADNDDITTLSCKGKKELTYFSKPKSIQAGEKCFYSKEEKVLYSKTATRSCTCSNGPDETKTVIVGQWCRTTDDCNAFDDIEEKIKQVCNNDGHTCSHPSGECNGKVKESQLIKGISKNKQISFIKKSVIDFDNFKVSAQTKNIKSQFVIDQQTGKFVNLPQGEYIFEYDGQQYYFEVTNSSGSKRIFIDKNFNNQYDEGTDILVSDLASTVQIDPIELKYTYKLEQGFNFVSFPFLVSNTDYRTAAGLLKKLNEVYDNSIYSIAKYDSSWKIVGQNVELYSSNDFQLVPGQGYVIKAKNDVTIDIWGKPIKYDKDSPNAPITLFKGWNLIGIYGSGVKQYTAKTLIEDINKYEKVDFTADNVSKWESDTQRYEGFQISDKNGVPTEYGFDYPINILNSYFVRVQNGEGNWQPELAQ